jgi:PAS domain S-box-containing protein
MKKIEIYLKRCKVFRMKFPIHYLVILVLSLSWISANGHTDTVWNYTSNKKILVSGDHYYPPFEFLNENGQPDGFNVEIFRLIASNLGLNYELQLLPWDQVRTKAENNEIDVVMGLMISPERAQKLIFGTPHSIMTHGIFSNKSRLYTNLSDLKGKKISVQKSDFMHDYLLMNQFDTEIIAVDSQLDALVMVESGASDAALIGNFQGAHLIKKYHLNQVVLTSNNIEPKPYGMAVNKGNEQLLSALNTGLLHLKVNGDYDRLYNKWFGVYEKQLFYKDMLPYGIGILVFVLVLGFFNVLLRWRIKTVTSSLRESEEKYRLLVQNQNDLIVKVDIQGRLTYVSPSYCVYFGKTEDELLNKNFMPLVHEDDQLSTRQAISSLTKTNLHVVHEQRAMSVKGWRWIVWSDTAILNDSGEIKEIIGVGRDITDQKEAEIALKASDERLIRLLDEATNIAVQGYDLNGTVLYWNNASTKLYGFEPEEAIGKNLMDLIIPDELVDQVKSDVQRMVETGVCNFSEELLLKHKSGKRVPVFSNHSIIEIPGKKKELFCIDIDLSQHLEDQAIIRKTNGQLKAIFENSFNIFVFLDNEGRLLLYNQTAVKFASDILQFVVARGEKLFNLIGKDQREDFRISFLKALQGQSVYEELLIFGKNSKKYWFNIHLSPMFDENGIVEGVVMIGNDVTSQHMSKLVQRMLFNITNAVSITSDLSSLLHVIKSELSSLIDSSNMFIAFYDETNGVLSTLEEDTSIEKISSWKAENSLSGMVVKGQRSLLLTNSQIQQLENDGFIKRVGLPSKIWLGVPLKSDGKTIGVLAVQSYENEHAYDGSSVELMEFISGQISQVIKRQQDLIALIDAKQKAEESDLLKTSFLNNLSHEIRTPLNCMLGLTDMIVTDEFSPEEKETYNKLIVQNGQQLTSIINDTVNMATLEAGQEKLFITDVNLENELAIIFQKFTDGFSEKGVQFTVDFDLPSSPFWIQADKTKLNDILSKLLDNALKYTDEGSVKLSVSYKNQSVEFSVTDTGIGIDPAFHSVIFEPFRKIETEIQRIYRGNGLGLSIVKSYVKMMGGSVWVESEIGKGSEFGFLIPVSLPDNSLESLNLVREITFDKDSKPVVLIAEDEDHNMEFLKSITKGLDINVLEAHNGLEVLRYFEKDIHIDLVLLDLKMPVLSGYDAASRLRSKGIDVPIIAVTAYALTGDEEKAIAAGCDDYLAKPFSREKILTMMQHYVHMNEKQKI